VQAGVLEINTNQPAVFVEVKHDAICDLVAIFAGPFDQVDI
jgi:hypothetical protein